MKGPDEVDDEQPDDDTPDDEPVEPRPVPRPGQFVVGGKRPAPYRKDTRGSSGP